MVDALIGGVIAVMATAALVLLFEVGDQAVQPEGKSLSKYEKKVVDAAAGSSNPSVTGTNLLDEYENVRTWMAEKRKF